MKKTLTIVAFGDSITALRKEVDLEHHWLYILEKDLENEFPDINFSVINSGVGGESDRYKMMRFNNDVLSYVPDYLLVQFGGNNNGFANPLKDVDLEEAVTLLEKLRKELLSNTRIIVITFPRVLDKLHQTMKKTGAEEYFSPFGGLDGYVEQYRKITRDFAAKYSYPLIDFSLAMRDDNPEDTYTLNDGVHLNIVGHQLLSKLVLSCLKNNINSEL